MPLTEDEAAKIILVRSIEEAEPGLFSTVLLNGALAAAGTVGGAGIGWVERRASYLFERIPASYQSILQLIKLPTPWTLPLCVLAFILGLATNLLGPTDKIHVVRNPVLALVAWNLLVYVTILAMWIFGRKFAFRRSAMVEEFARSGAALLRHREPKVPWMVRIFLPGLWHLFHKIVFGLEEKKSLTKVLRRFRANWLSVAGPLVVARSKCALHLAALFLAAGAIGGMYFRGLFQGYEVIWASTFITDEGRVSTLISIVFGPSLLVAQLCGLGLAEQISMMRLMSPEGDEADAWIHLFAITIAIAVITPRALMATWQWRIVKIRSRDLTLSLDKYYGDMIEAPIRFFVDKEVEQISQEFSEDVADFVTAKLYDEQIVPRLRVFREQGGRIADLKSDVSAITERFLPQLKTYIDDCGLPRFRTSLTARISDMLKSVGADFANLGGPEQIISELKIATPEFAEARISGQLSAAATVSAGTTIAVALGTVAGGIGEELGIAVIASVLGTTGPVGLVIGLMVGALVAAGAWWYGGQKITAAVEKINLSPVVVSTALWSSRFQRLIDDGRKQCKDSVQATIDDKLRMVKPKITEEVLFRVRQAWVF